MAKTIRLKTHHKPIYKYNINQQIGLLPFKKNLIDELVSHLIKHGITRNEFYADRKIPFGSDKSIPADRLYIYATVFDCDVNDLMNQPVKATSFRHSVSSFKIKSSLK